MMMKKMVLSVLACALICLCAAAQALDLPSNALFSPGLKKLSGMEKENPSIQAQAQVNIDKAMYARDLSVLRAMLDGTTITYARSDGNEAVSISRSGEALGAYAMPQGKTLDALVLLEEKLLGTPVLERVPLASIAAWLEGLAPGDTLIGGFQVFAPFVLERTMSDDGTRLTKIRISGAIGQEGEMPYSVSGYLRQPAGRAPKDTFELTFRQDEDNCMELLYSALRENEVTSRNKAGTVSVRTTLKAAGRIAGYGISSRLSVTAKNAWKSDGEALSERISITASLGHTDKTPGRRMQRLNDAAAEIKNVIRLTTRETDDVLELTDEITFDVTLDSNAFLAGSADMTLRAGGQAADVPQELAAMDETAAKALAAKLYRLLDKDTLDIIHKGL